MSPIDPPPCQTPDRSGVPSDSFGAGPLRSGRDRRRTDGRSARLRDDRRHQGDGADYDEVWQVSIHSTTHVTTEWGAGS